MAVPNLIKDTVFRAITSIGGDKEGLVCLPVLRGPAKGLRFELDLVRRRESAYCLGTYDTKILQTLRSVVQPGWVIWDVGTYLGFYTVYFHHLVGAKGKVLAIEPDPRNRERTGRNVRLNKFEFSGVAAAVGAPLGEIDFLLSDDSNSHIQGVYIGAPQMKNTYQEKDREKKTIRIQCNSLDQLHFEKGLPAPDLIKIDIEGAELYAVQHLHRLCSEVKPLLLLELHNAECDAQAWRFAQSTGYVLYDAETMRRIVRPEDVHGTLLCRPGDAEN